MNSYMSMSDGNRSNNTPSKCAPNLQLLLHLHFKCQPGHSRTLWLILWHKPLWGTRPIFHNSSRRAKRAFGAKESCLAKMNAASSFTRQMAVQGRVANNYVLLETFFLQKANIVSERTLSKRFKNWQKICRRVAKAYILDV